MLGTGQQGWESKRLGWQSDGRGGCVPRVDLAVGFWVLGHAHSRLVCQDKHTGNIVLTVNRAGAEVRVCQAWL